MNFKHIGIVLKKELKDAFRDKKSVITNIVLPIVMIPAIYFIMNMVISNTSKDAEENSSYAIIASESIKTQAEEFVKQNIIGEDKTEIKSYEKEQDVEKAITDGDVSCAIKFEDTFFENLEKGITSGITIKYNSTKNKSSIGMQALNAKTVELNQKLAASKLAEMNISPEILNMISTNMEDVYTASGDSGSSSEMLMMIIPMYLAIIIVTAGTPIAIDIFAGERERNTFEALLSTKANRLSILIGKYISVVLFSIIAIITSFIGLIIGIGISPELFNAGDGGIMATLASLNIPIMALLLALLSAITLAIVFAGIQIVISVYARTLKEAQTYASYLMIPSMIPAFMSMFMGAGDMQSYMMFIPIFNTIASLKMTLAGVIDYPSMIIGVVANLVFAGIITAIVIRMFNNEKIVIK